MYLERTLLCFLILPVFSACSQSLSGDSVSLSEVEVSASRQVLFSNSSKTETLDSSLLSRYSNANLADILANESQVFVKSYGLGSLATTSFRGGSAGHTAVLWNGFSLQSPMHGLIDFALIPLAFVNDVKIDYGGGGALWGSGAVGGSIHLNNRPLFGRGTTADLNISFGSFSDQQQQLGVEYSAQRFTMSVKAFRHIAKNDFPFINTAKYGKPEENQTNAELWQHGILQEYYFHINEKQTFNTRFWYQYNSRNIPPAMTQNINVSNQKDESYRVTSEWERKTQKLSLQLRAAYFDEFLGYSDTLINLESKSHSGVIIAEAEGRYSLGNIAVLNLGITNTYSEAQSKDYISSPGQERLAAFTSFRAHTKTDSWSVVLSLRQEFVNGDPVPFAPSIGIRGNFLKYFAIKLNAAKHYRIPTFNDLYWAQGGNPDLQAENGWSEEGSLEHRYEGKFLSWELAATAFNRNIDNWIIWLPNNYGIWSPENVLSVWSRGVEYKLVLELKKEKFLFRLSGFYNYILSTNEKAATPTDPALGKQLIYVPIQNAQGSSGIGYGNTSLTYTQIYTGYRYTLSDNTAYLFPYTIGNVSLSHTFRLRYSAIKVYAQLNNVWNETYQVLAYRAMPLMNWQAGLSLSVNEPLNENKKQKNK